MLEKMLKQFHRVVLLAIMLIAAIAMTLQYQVHEQWEDVLKADIPALAQAADIAIQAADLHLLVEEAAQLEHSYRQNELHNEFSLLTQRAVKLKSQLSLEGANSNSPTIILCNEIINDITLFMSGSLKLLYDNDGAANYNEIQHNSYISLQENITALREFLADDYQAEKSIYEANENRLLGVSIFIFILLGMLISFYVKRLEASRQSDEENYQTALLNTTILNTINESVVITDSKNNIVSVNPAFTTITGYRAEEVINKNPRILQSGKQAKSFYKKMWQTIQETGTWQGEVVNKRKDDTEYDEWLSIATINDTGGNIQNYIAIFSDITARKKHEALIKHQALHDPLTNLANRSLFMNHLSKAIDVANREQGAIAILYLDLDKFKAVNDTLGHKAGDLVLIETAKRLTQNLRKVDTIARLGGDEFAIILGSVSNHKQLHQLCDPLISEIAKPIYFKGECICIGCSIGAAIYPTHHRDIDTLIRLADDAMYRAKKEGGGLHIHT